jgi:hypothetical protein
MHILHTVQIVSFIHYVHVLAIMDRSQHQCETTLVVHPKRNTGYVIVFGESFHARVFALVHSISIVSCFLVLLVDITSLKYLGYVEKKEIMKSTKQLL